MPGAMGSKEAAGGQEAGTEENRRKAPPQERRSGADDARGRPASPARAAGAATCRRLQPRREQGPRARAPPEHVRPRYQRAAGLLPAVATGRRLRRDRCGCVPCAAVHGLRLDRRRPAGGRAMDGVGRAHRLRRARRVSGALGGPGVHGRPPGGGHGRAPGRRRPRPRRRPDLRARVGRCRVVPHCPESCGWASQRICSRHRCSSDISPGAPSSWSSGSSGD